MTDRRPPSDLLRLAARRTKALRKARKLSRAKLAALVGVHEQTVTHFEFCERGITLDTLCAFAAALDVHLVALLVDPEDPGSVDGLALALVQLVGKQEASAALRRAKALASRRDRSAEVNADGAEG